MQMKVVGYSTSSMNKIKFDALKSGLQKLIRRGNETESLFCLVELDLMKQYPLLANRYYRKVKGLRSNYRNRLCITLVEDVGIADWTLYTPIKKLLDEWELRRKSEDNSERAYLVKMVKLLANSQKTRALSHLKTVFGMGWKVMDIYDKFYQNDKSLMDMQTIKVPKYGEEFYKEKDSVGVRNIIDGFTWCLDNISDNVFYWYFLLMRTDAVSGKRGAASKKPYIMWQIIKNRIKGLDNKYDNLKELCDTHYFLFKKYPNSRNEQNLYLMNIILFFLRKEDINWNRDKTIHDGVISDEEVNNIYKINFDFYKKGIAKRLPQFVYDMHTSEGKKAGKNSKDFAVEGSFVNNESKFTVDKYKAIYNAYKLADTENLGESFFLDANVLNPEKIIYNNVGMNDNIVCNVINYKNLKEMFKKIKKNKRMEMLVHIKEIGTNEVYKYNECIPRIYGRCKKVDEKVNENYLIGVKERYLEDKKRSKKDRKKEERELKKLDKIKAKELRRKGKNKLKKVKKKSKKVKSKGNTVKLPKKLSKYSYPLCKGGKTDLEFETKQITGNMFKNKYNGEENLPLVNILKLLNITDIDNPCESLNHMLGKDKTTTCKAMTFVNKDKRIVIKEMRSSFDSRENSVMDEVKLMFNIHPMFIRRVRAKYVVDRIDKKNSNWVDNMELIKKRSVYLIMPFWRANTDKNSKGDVMNTVTRSENLLWDEVGRFRIMKILVFRAIFRCTDSNYTNILVNKDYNVLSIDENNINKGKRILPRYLKKPGYNRKEINEVLDDICENKENKLKFIKKKLKKYDLMKFYEDIKDRFDNIRMIICNEMDGKYREKEIILNN